MNHTDFMGLTPEEKEKIESATIELSDLLVSIYEEELPKDRIPTDVDSEFKEKLFELQKINSLLADGFVLMYNHIQNKKIKPRNSYVKRFRKETELEFSPTIFEIYARQIWNQGYFSEDEIRWHTSGTHIQDNQLTIEDTIEDAWEILGSITPDEVKINISLENWNIKYIDNPEMIAAMAKEIYSQVKEYGKYAFKDEPDWNAEVKEYVDAELGDS